MISMDIHPTVAVVLILCATTLIWKVVSYLIPDHRHFWEDCGETIKTFETPDSPQPYKRRQPQRCVRCGKRRSVRI